MNLAILNLGFDPVAMMRRAKSKGLARVTSFAQWTRQDGAAKRDALRAEENGGSATGERCGVFKEAPLKRGSGKAVLLALQVGEVLPVLDPHDLHKWQALGRHYKVKLTKVAGGLKRTI